MQKLLTKDFFGDTMNKIVQIYEVIVVLEELLKTYNLPELPTENTRDVCLDIMQKHEFGYIPAPPKTLNYEVLDASDVRFAGGKTIPTTVRLYGKTSLDTDYSFPIRVCVPKKEGKYPFFVHINFRPNIPDKYQPTEEIIDNGFAVLSFCYNEVTSDDGDFTNGLAKAFYPNGAEGRDPLAPGKIAMWAWAAMRVMDYAHIALSHKLDFDNAAVCGHSRLGKTALLTGAYDERFKFVFSNCAGCGGDALERNHNDIVSGGKPDERAERIEDIIKNFWYWFCENYKSYAGKDPKNMPFDQHFLTCCIAPRHFYVVSAAEDIWADPINQFMNCVAVSDYFKSFGNCGFVTPNKLPEVNTFLMDGHIGFHIREGSHSQNRTDWLAYMEFLKKNLG